MATASTQPRIVSKEDLDVEIKARIATLDFSNTQRGPNCKGCFNIALGTVCGHVYIVRERCQPKGLVCAGSRLLVVHWDDFTVALGDDKCQFCHRVHKYQGNHSESLTKRYDLSLKFTKKKMTSKARMEAIKEQWQRECVEQGLPVAGLTRAQLDALEAEKEKGKDTKVSPSSSDSKSVLPDSSDSAGAHPGMLHDPNLEWMERSKCLVDAVGCVTRAEYDSDSEEDFIDPRPAFIFCSPFLSKSLTPAYQAHVETEDQTSSETKCS